MNTAIENFEPRSFDEKKEKLVADLKSVLADADDLLKEVVNSTADEFAAIRTKVEGKLCEARVKLESARSVALEKSESVTEYIQAHPAKTLGTAALAGLVLGFIFSRR